jgi:hypothetical protein
MPPTGWEHIGWIGVQAAKNLVEQTQGDGLLAHLQAVEGRDRHARHARKGSKRLLATAFAQPAGEMPVEGARRGGHPASCAAIISRMRESLLDFVCPR